MIKPDLSAIISHSIICQRCKTKMAEIFQESGDYCLNCWQVITYPVSAIFSIITAAFI
jgi:hypothetical protein